MQIRMHEIGRWACVIDLQVASILVAIVDDVANAMGTEQTAGGPPNGIFRLFGIPWVVIFVDWTSVAELA